MTKPLDSLKQPNPSEKTAPRDDWLDSVLGKPVQYVSSIGLVVEGGKDWGC